MQTLIDRLRQLVTASLLLLLMLINTLVLIGPLMLVALLKWLARGAVRRQLSIGVMWIAELWAEISKAIFAWLLPTRWDIRGQEGLSRTGSYLVLSNHQSWVDIPALVMALNRRTPYFKFFLKRELLWVPFLGLAFWALDYPFMRRYSKQTLKRHPELRGKDLETTREACKKFRDLPVTVVNYVEGTRFTVAKKQAQQSPYRNLLKPKAGGMAYTLSVMGDCLDELLDVTIVYPPGPPPGFWCLISGQLPWVLVDIQRRPLDPWLWQGDYSEDPAFQAQFQAWLGAQWQRKDEYIDDLRRQG